MSDERLRNLIDVPELCVQRLSDSVQTPPVDQRDLAGIIKAFEFTFEQAHKCLMELLLATGEEDSRRSVKMVLRRAFEFGWIANEEAYTAMIRDRNAMSHTHDAEFAKDMVDRIASKYLPLFRELQMNLKLESSRLANE